MKNTIDCWGLPGSQIVQYRSIDDAISDILEEWYTGKGKEYPESITLEGFTFKKPDLKSEAEFVLGELLYSLDSEFHTETPDTEPTEAMKKAAYQFVESVLKDYEVTTLEFVCTKTININDWLKKRGGIKT